MLPACDCGDDGHLVSVAVVFRVVEDSGRLPCGGKVQVACYRLHIRLGS